MLFGDLLGGLSVKGNRTGQHLIKQYAHRIDVALGVGFLSAGLLGTDVVHRPDGPVLHSPDILSGKPGDAEIHYLDGAIPHQHDVLGLDVPMHHTVLMGMLQGPQNLSDKMDGILPPQLTLVADILIQGDAIDIFHDDILISAGKVHIKHLDDVGVVQHGNDLGLVSEPADKLVVGQVLLL